MEKENTWRRRRRSILKSRSFSDLTEEVQDENRDPIESTKQFGSPPLVRRRVSFARDMQVRITNVSTDNFHDLTQATKHPDSAVEHKLSTTFRLEGDFMDISRNSSFYDTTMMNFDTRELTELEPTDFVDSAGIKLSRTIFMEDDFMSITQDSADDSSIFDQSMEILNTDKKDETINPVEERDDSLLKFVDSESSKPLGSTTVRFEDECMDITEPNINTSSFFDESMMIRETEVENEKTENVELHQKMLNFELPNLASTIPLEMGNDVMEMSKFANTNTSSRYYDSATERRSNPFDTRSPCRRSSAPLKHAVRCIGVIQQRRGGNSTFSDDSTKIAEVKDKNAKPDQHVSGAAGEPEAEVKAEIKHEIPFKSLPKSPWCRHYIQNHKNLRGLDKIFVMEEVGKEILQLSSLETEKFLETYGANFPSMWVGQTLDYVKIYACLTSNVADLTKLASLSVPSSTNLI